MPPKTAKPKKAEPPAETGDSQEEKDKLEKVQKKIDDVTETMQENMSMFVVFRSFPLFCFAFVFLCLSFSMCLLSHHTVHLHTGSKVVKKIAKKDFVLLNLRVGNKI